MIYLYLTKRDKKDVKLVTLLQGMCPVLMKVTNISALDLPVPWTKTLEDIVVKEKMYFDLWMESATDILELQKRLKDRGYKQVPIMTTPMVWLSSIPTGAKIEEHDRFIHGNYAPEIDPIAMKKMHIAHEKMRRSTF